MKCSILKKSSKKLWITTLNRFPQEARGIFFYPEYLELYEKKGESANCFICEEGEKIFLYPFLIIGTSLYQGKMRYANRKSKPKKSNDLMFWNPLSRKRYPNATRRELNSIPKLRI